MVYYWAAHQGMNMFQFLMDWIKIVFILICVQRFLSANPKVAIKRLPPIGSSFKLKDLQTCQFVDKTNLLARLLTDKGVDLGVFLFIPARRRVGKSSAMDMLAAMAKGEKEYFQGYAVSKDDSPFTIGAEKFPVIKV